MEECVTIFCTFGGIITEFVCNWYTIQHPSLSLLPNCLFSYAI